MPGENGHGAINMAAINSRPPGSDIVICHPRSAVQRGTRTFLCFFPLCIAAAAAHVVQRRQRIMTKGNQRAKEINAAAAIRPVLQLLCAYLFGLLFVKSWCARPRRASLSLGVIALFNFKCAGTALRHRYADAKSNRPPHHADCVALHSSLFSAE